MIILINTHAALLVRKEDHAKMTVVILMLPMKVVVTVTVRYAPSTFVISLAFVTSHRIHMLRLTAIR